MTTPHPFVQLRREIRQSASQFRNKNDNSQSLFNPDCGFEYAYTIYKVEAALDRYQETLQLDLVQESFAETVKKRAQELRNAATDEEVEDFIQNLMLQLNRIDQQ